jgi:acetylornithine deacetylase/succinyl-diaminopimelate desuccinylase-like protein
MLDKILTTIDQRREESLEGLKEFLRIPSVSTRPAHAPDMRRCADWLAGQLSEAGLSVEVAATNGHPAVLAKNPHQGDRPTVLVYGHYDVQPPEPLELWTTPPFEPTVRDGSLYARGSADDKGQVWTHVQAARAWEQSGGAPVNLIFLIEGEEEIGSPNLAAFMQERKDELKADIAVISDTSQYARGIPAVTYGLKGLVYMEVFLKGASHDLHSGVYGGAVPNPANALCELLATLHDDQGRVNIPGFYDDVLAVSDAERAEWRKLPFDDEAFKKELNLQTLPGEAGYSTIERKWARPTCDINGLTSGYQGHGAKTIIPATASAKVSMRLVPNQNPVKIQAAFEQTLRDRCPAGCTIEFKQHGLADPVLVPIDSDAMKRAADALRIGFNTEPTFMREGGSIPVVGLIKSILGIDTLLLGFGLPDDRIHSPNENFDLDALHNGTRSAAALYQSLRD